MRDADHGGEREAGEQPQHGLERVMRQDAVDGQVTEGGRDRLQRGKQPRRKHAGARHDLPQRADDDERKGVAPDDAPALAPRLAPGPDVSRMAMVVTASCIAPALLPIFVVWPRLRGPSRRS